MDLEERMKQLGKLQKGVLLWLSEEEELETPEAITKRWPTSYRIPASRGILGDLAAMLEPWTRAFPYFQEEASHAKYLSRDYLDAQAPPGVRWSAKRFLGHPPGRGDSATLSKTIADLEKRGLIKTYKAVGKRQRTSHVSLTVHGAIAALILRRRRNQ